MADEEWYESVGFEVTLWMIFVIIPCFLPAITMFGKSSGYFRRLSMAFYFYMWIYIIALVLMKSLTQLYVLESMETVFKVGIPVTHLLVVFEHFYCSEFEYIKNLSDTTGIEEFLKTLRQSLAVITFHAKCYHWETRTRTVTERDSKGNYLRTRYETYQEMVVTHTDFETYNYGRQVDASGDAITDTKGASKTVTRVKLSKTWVLGDELTKRDFHAKNEAFQDRNRGRDVHFEGRIDFAIPSFVEHITLTKDSSGAPFWIGQCWFTMATLIGMSWPYRWLFRAATGRAEYTVAKKIFLQ